MNALAVFLVLACATDRPPATPAGPQAVRVATLPIPGGPSVVEAARDVVAVRVALAPNLAAEAGLVEDALRVPSFAPDTAAELVARLDHDLALLRDVDWDGLPVDRQIDLRWLVANAEEARQRLVTERRWTHRPGEWLEPVGYTFVALLTADLPRATEAARLAALVPDMVEEMRALCTAPTARDVEAAVGMIEGQVAVLAAVPDGPEREGAVAAYQAYATELRALHDLPEFRVIGAESYTWRLQRAMLQPWSPDALLAVAQAELDRVDAELATIDLSPVPGPAPEEIAEAEALDRDALLRLYDEAVEANLAALRGMDALTVPPDLPPIRARETPPSVIPLSGDGGSMNPPPLFGAATNGWWNVETWRPDWTQEERLQTVQAARRQATTWFGYYAVHEGVPGHHLQLAMARATPNPLRTLLTDYAAVEGWALYAEQLFWEHGGFGDTPRAHANMLRSYRGRVRRVFYDVNVEMGRWTLREAAEWRAGKAGVEVDRDVLRAINWPTQLIGYFTGKKQILDLREEARRRDGYSERDFHDRLLAEGQIPIALIRAKLLGEPVPRP